MILSIDPGRTTGIAVVNQVVLDEAGELHYNLVDAAEVPWLDRFWFHAFFAAHHGKLERIVIENFRLFAHKAQAQINSEFPSVRVIGIVEAYAHLHQLDPIIVFQAPYDRKQVRVPVEHQQQVGRSLHCQDAYRQLRYYLLTNKDHYAAKA